MIRSQHGFKKLHQITDAFLFNRTTRRQDMIQEKKMEQVKIEADTWKRLLDFFMEENVHAKNRLSNILKDGFDRDLLDELENFQSQFIKQDEMINLLRRDIAELSILLSKENGTDEVSTNLLNRKLENLRYNLADSERRFSGLQLNFNKYLSKSVG